ncbi:MAG: hypothetical protein WEC81_00040 [Patescibacteria group bacterium]
MEHLGSILGSNSDYLSRIYLSTKLQQYLKTFHKEPVKVVVRNKLVVLSCKSPAQATFFRLRRAQLYAQLTNILGKGHGYTVRVKVSY